MLTRRTFVFGGLAAAVTACRGEREVPPTPVWSIGEKTIQKASSKYADRKEPKGIYSDGKYLSGIVLDAVINLDVLEGVVLPAEGTWLEPKSNGIREYAINFRTGPDKTLGGILKIAAEGKDVTYAAIQLFCGRRIVPGLLEIPEGATYEEQKKILTRFTEVVFDLPPSEWEQKRLPKQLRPEDPDVLDETSGIVRGRKFNVHIEGRNIFFGISHPLS